MSSTYQDMLDVFNAAMEADDEPEAQAPTSTVDLTKATTSLMKKAASRTTSDDISNFSDTEPEDTAQDEGEPDDSVTDGPDGENPDVPPAVNDAEMDTHEDPMASPEETAAQTRSEAKRFYLLHNNIHDLYNRVNVAIDSIGTSGASTGNTDELRKIYNSAVGHLNNIYEMLQTMLESPMTAETYPEKMKNFIALRHVYIIVVDMLDEHHIATKLINGQ